MKKELADFILNACNNADTFFECEGMPEIYENYSGRGMFGKKTTGIVCNNVMPVMAAVVCEFRDLEVDDWIDFEFDAEDIRHIKIDSVGNQTILY